MININYTKSCYSESLLIEGSGINLYFIYDLEIEEEQKQQYINDLELYKNIIKHLFFIYLSLSLYVSINLALSS
jgi:hypothetical protein